MRIFLPCGDHGGQRIVSFINSEVPMRIFLMLPVCYSLVPSLERSGNAFACSTFSQQVHPSYEEGRHNDH